MSPIRHTAFLALVLMLLLVGAGDAAEPRLGAKARTYERANDAKFRKAMGLLREERYAEGLPLLEELVRSDPRNGLFWYNLGNARFRLERYREAIEAYRKVVDLRSPISAVAWLYIASARRRLGDWAGAERILAVLAQYKLPPELLRQVREDLAELRAASRDKALQAALERFDARDFEGARIEAEKVAAATGLAEAHLLKALAELRLGQGSRARESLQRVLNHPGAERASREEARILLRQIHEGLWERQSRIAGFIDLSAGFNSNVFAAGKSGDAQARAVAEVLGGVSYLARSEQGYSVRFDYLPSWSEIVGSPEDRFIGQLGRIRVSRELREWLIQAGLSLQHDVLDHKAYQLRPALLLRGERTIPGHELRAGLSYELARNLPLDSEFAYLAGLAHQLRAYAAKSTRRADFSFGLLYQREAIGDLGFDYGTLPLASQGYGASGASIWYLSPAWELSGSLSVVYKVYDQLSDPGAIPRKDLLTLLGARVDRLLAPKTRLYAAPALALNESTLGETAVVDKNYVQFLLNLGLTLDLP